MVMATPVATVPAFSSIGRQAKRLPLGEILSGWRDLNSRPLDPQERARGNRPCSLVLADAFLSVKSGHRKGRR
jgi:hypothetical protein